MAEDNTRIDHVSIALGGGFHFVLSGERDLAGTEGTVTVVKAGTFLAHALKLMISKDADYGGAWREQGWMGNLSRIMSKNARLRNMLWRDLHIEGSEESVDETLLDLINLCVFALINRQSRNRWGTFLR